LTPVNIASGYCNYHLWEDARSMYEKISPNALNYDTFYILVSYHCHAGLIDTAFDYLMVMYHSGITPTSVFLFQLMIEKLLSVDIDRAQQVYDIMAEYENLDRKRPNVDRMMLIGYCQRGKLDRAIRFLNDIPVEERQYTDFLSLIEACIEEGNMQQMISLYNNMNLDPKKDISSLVIGALLRREMIDELCQILRSRDVDLSEVQRLFAATLKKWFNKGNVNNTKIVFESIQHPTTLLYNTMIEQYFMEGNPQMALQILSKMSSKQATADQGTFNIVLQYNDNLDEVMQILGVMKSRALSVETRTGNILIAKLCKRKRWKDARDVFDAIKEKDQASYSDLVLHYSSQQNVKQLELLLAMMLNQRFAIDSTLIKILDKEPQSKKVLRRVIQSNEEKRRKISARSIK
jgi:pentatricopeptide repeat protein